MDNREPSPKAATQQEQPAEDGPFDIEALPDELLAEVFRAAGLKETLKALVGSGSGRLHRAWQAAVTSLRIGDQELAASDGGIIAKYANLERLELDWHRQGPPVWHVLNLAAPSLAGLKRLSIDECKETFGVLRFLAGCTPLQRSLEDLELEDNNYRLSEADLWGLQGLTRLSSLALDCQQLDGSFSGVAGMLAQPSSLRSMDLYARRIPDASQLATLPGCMTQLTRLELSSDPPEDREEEEEEEGAWEEAIPAQQEGLAATVWCLTNLQGLWTNYALMASEAQRQSLGRLQQLTALVLSGSDGLEPLVVLPQLSSLVELNAECTVVRNPFPHPSLQKLKVAGIEQDPPTAAGQPALQQALGCPLRELVLAIGGGRQPSDDAELQHLPQLLPGLMMLNVWLKPGADGRFRHLAALLHRQAGTLQELHLQLLAPFQQVLPRALPACRVLAIENVDRHTLSVLAMCRLPALEVLTLELCALAVSRLDAELDFGWLRGLPALMELFVMGAGHAELRQAVPALLQGSGVEVGVFS